MKLGSLSSKLSILVPALLCAVAGVSLAQVPVWEHNIDFGGFYSAGRNVATSPDSAVVVISNYTDAALRRRFSVMKLSQRTGDTLWLQHWLGDSLADSSRMWTMAVDDSGNVFAACYTAVGFNWDWLTLKYLPDGTLAWAARYDNSGGFDVSLCILPDGKGGVFVGGSSSTPSGWVDATAIHYDADGDSTWRFILDGPAHQKDHFWALAPGPDGSLYATGDITVNVTQAYDFLTVRIDSLGDSLWSRVYDGSASGNPLIENDVAIVAATDAAGNCYVGGKAGEAGEWINSVVVKYAPDGSQQWVHRFDWGSAGTEVLSHLGLDLDGNVYAGGCVDDGDGWDMLLYCIGQDDTVPPDTLWRVRVDNNVFDDDSLTGMVVDQLGNSYVTGKVNTSNLDVEWWTLKFGPDGTQIWKATNGIFDNDCEPFDLALDARGDVYVTGYETPASTQPIRVTTIRYTETDVGVLRVSLAGDTFRVGATVRPWAWVRNFGGLTQAGFPVRLDIGAIYTDAQNVDSVPAFDSVLVQFSSLQVEARALGTNPVVCYTMLAEDKELANDTARGSMTAVNVWQQLASLPLGAKSKDIKDGGTLGFAGDSLVLAFKGNNTAEFYGFNTRRGIWVDKESIPPIGRSGTKKRVKAGARLASDPFNFVYAFKGNNTLEFWRYSVGGDSWFQLADVPSGASGKRVKGGSALHYVPWQHKLYAAKGNGTLEFYSYDVASGAWSPRTSVPMGSYAKLKDGTVSGYDGDSTIFVLKGAYKGYEFWSYNVASDSWRLRKPLRNSRLTSKSNKMKKGAAMAYDTEFDRAWTMKGGKLLEFWYFDARRDTWVETDDLFPTPPLGKGPYAGGDLCYGAGKVYAFRGNKTRDFYRYHANFPLTPPDTWDGPQARVTVTPRLKLAAAPNPFHRLSWLHYALPRAGHVRLVVYDITGRVRQTLVDRRQGRGEFVAPLRADNLAAGVYVAKLWLTTGDETEVVTRKVLVAR